MNGELYPGEFEAMARQGRLDAVIPEQKMMTREEAIMVLKNEQPHCGKKALFPEEKKYEAYNRAIKALEQEPKTGHCKDCKYFEYDSVAKVDGIPLIVAHEICSRWGDGCKTKEDGYCFLFEPQERNEE